ncbi:MAG: esterase-like activity of phytase family protein [Vicinamibacterales bacterium]
MRHVTLAAAMAAAAVAAGSHSLMAAPPYLDLIATGSINGLYQDFAEQTAGPLESGTPGNRLGGIGSGLAYLGGDWFLALPDRGPNATEYNDCAGDRLDNTTSYIPRFHTMHLALAPADTGAPLPFVLTPMLVDTTLLSSRTPLVYGNGCGVAGNGAPALNRLDHRFYFSGRSDNFAAGKNSLYAGNGRFDPESIRVSRDGRSVYISDEYGPYVHEFDRRTGERTRVFSLPAKFAVNVLSSHGDDEISIANNPVGRIANKGMEALAITPDGRTLVGMMQSALEQDGGDVKGQVVRIVTIDVRSGATREYAYPTDAGTKTTISDIVAINDTEFLVDERDSKGLGDDSAAAFKRLYTINLQGATEVSGLTGRTALAAAAVKKSLFLDIVQVLNVVHGMPVADIPAKLEGIAFGQDVTVGGKTRHTLWVANDNDFLQVVPNATHSGGTAQNPNQYFVFAFDDNDLPNFQPQQNRWDSDDREDERGDER